VQWAWVGGKHAIVQDRQVIGFHLSPVRQQLESEVRPVPQPLTNDHEPLATPSPRDRSHHGSLRPGCQRIRLNPPVQSFEHTPEVELHILDGSIAQDLVRAIAPPHRVRDRRARGFGLNRPLGEVAQSPLDRGIVGGYREADPEDLEAQRFCQMTRPSSRS
jgi:hypothetical protein